MASRFLYLVRHGEAGEDAELTARGEQQARLTGERLRDVPLTGIYTSPEPRAVRTAEILAGFRPGLPPVRSDLLGDYIPSDPELADLPPDYRRLVRGYSPAERAAGATLARSAVATFGRLGRLEPAGFEPGGLEPGGPEEHELIVTHNFLIGWFVREALGAPDWRWLGLNQQNCALTVLRYRAALPPALISFNDAAHLTGPLRWTGFPDSLRPRSG
jgi:serine/threonine-protein phosphatase PGAM5